MKNRTRSRVEGRESRVFGSLRTPHSAFRTGYTLVEMLVAVALVVLMMMMFAEIFTIAAGSISTQRGLAELDQSARTLTTVLRSDLNNRTFRALVPFFPGEQSANAQDPPPLFSQRSGYFYIAENDPNDDTDDVLQFTIRSLITLKDVDEQPYFGRATLLTPAGSFLDNPNQPDADDGQTVPDSTSTSTAAEVSYFLRNGILYRRVLLIRDPLPLAGADPQPTNSSGTNFFDPSAGLYGGDFWNDFDFSAYATDDGAGTNRGAQFHGFDSLDNSGKVGFFPLGNPKYRFGHNHLDGQPREFVSDGTSTWFIGRFTHEETSHGAFNYPQANSAVGNPMDAGTNLGLFQGVVSYDAGADGSFGTADDLQFSGPRRGEDILLTNVHSFDVEVWDERLGAFVDIGHSEPPNALSEQGDFDLAHRDPITGGYGGNPTSNRVFDTWHPQIDFDGNGIVDSDDSAPYRPMSYYPAGPAPNSTLWAAGGTHSVGDVVAPENPAVTNNPFRPFGAAFAYRCVRGGTSGGIEPTWPTTPGTIVRDGSDPVLWQTVENLRPLRAIRIKIRFLHVSTGQMRQLTLAHFLED